LYGSDEQQNTPAPTARLTLLDGFALWLGGRRVTVPLTSQRLLAMLALHEQPLQRTYVAGMLWSDYAERRAIANLRCAIARLPRSGNRLVQVVGRQLGLADWVAVDVRETSDLTQRIIDHDERILRTKGVQRRLAADLLPDWYDDWVGSAQERYRELRLHALEVLCDAQAATGDFAAAIEAGLAAVAGEPLRESAQRALIRTYLAEGNQATAVRQYLRYRSLLQDELGLAPSPSLAALLPVASCL
jgi:DNA-binding SARP family transcriptional activator